jgi:hypothetical protein
MIFKRGLFVLAALVLLFSASRIYVRLKPVNKADEAMSRYGAAMQADNYGGQSPAETLALFLAALDKGDVELASKYFMLDSDTKSPDYLTRNKWRAALEAAKKENRLQDIAATLHAAVPDPDGIAYDGDFKFKSLDGSGNVEAYVNMERNRYSGVWKIESL